MALASALWTEGHRTPLQPLPVGLQYLQESLGHLGALGAGLVLVGAARAWKTRRREAVALVFVSLVVWLSLVIQRDWIEGDKARIWLSAWTPVPLFFGLAIAWLQERGDRLRPALLLVAGSVAAFGLAAAMRSLDAPADAESPARKLVYQSDTPAFARFYRERYARVGLLPDYARLGDKLDLWRKRRLETMTAATLASAVKRTELASVGWFRRAFAVTRPEPVPAGEQPTMSVEVDLERLVTDPPGALRPAPRGALPFVDLTRARELREVHYKAVPVTWQPEPLTLTAFPRGAPARAAGELVLELNAFVSLGRDAGGLERVAAVHLLPSLAQRARTDHHGLRGRGPHRALRARGILQSVGAPPQRDREPRVVLTVPGGFRVVLRYWVVDGELGTPFRVDSWVIEAGDDGRPAAAFRPCEPESYL